MLQLNRNSLTLEDIVMETIDFETFGREARSLQSDIYISIELSRLNWLVGVFCPALGNKIHVHSVASGETDVLLAFIERYRAKVVTSKDAEVRVFSCFEAGYDGFWLHRFLVAKGIESHVLDGASLPVDRRAKHIKTDRIDARRLVNALFRYVQGDSESCRVVRPPTPEEEDAKRLHRERKRLVQERTAHLSRIKALLMAQGIRALRITDATWPKRLDHMRTGDGRPLPERLKMEIIREWHRLKGVAEQIAEVEKERNEQVKLAPGNEAEVASKIGLLVRLRGIGPDFATILMREVFYRRFENQRQVASYMGLTPAPFSSGDSQTDQGLDKSGNARARCAAVQMAWMWLRHQPQSELSLWYMRRVGDMQGRIRRIMIIGLARKLVIALWRFVHSGVVPTGAVIQAR